MKIGIANDQPLATEALRRVVALEPGHQVIWTASNGAEAVALCARQRPDLVLMDLLMPHMDGVEATRRIMAQSPCAILIVTSIGINDRRTYEAMGYGALDGVDLPELRAGRMREGAAPLLAKIDTVGRLIGDKIRATSAYIEGAAKRAAIGEGLIAMGASAGGPSALAAVLSALPQDLSACVVIIQHVDMQFAPGMAEWLDQQCPLPVRVAQEGDLITPGEVLLASTNDHLILKTATSLGYTAEPKDYIYRPSIDVFFQSVSLLWQGGAIGVLLTGMGRDGALGLKALRNRGYETIAQDEASSAVYGMPKAAAAVRAATHILPLNEIAGKIAAISRTKFRARL